MDNITITQFSIPFSYLRRLLIISSFAILFQPIVPHMLFANEKVNYVSYLPESPPIRSTPAVITTKGEHELLAEGYIPIGNIEVLYDTQKCIDDTCTQFPHIEDATSRLLKEAAIKGGELVILTTKNRIREKEDIIQKECLKSEKREKKIDVPVYQLEKRGSTTFKKFIGYEDKIEEKTFCTEYRSWIELKSSIVSRGIVWRKSNNGGFGKNENKQKPQVERNVPLARANKKPENSDTQNVGFINKFGSFIIKPRYNAALEFSHGLAAVQITEGGKWGYIDKSGKTVIDPIFEKAEPFKEDLALVKIGGRFGYIGQDGIFYITPKFKNAFAFSEGLAAVKIKKHYGFIDKTGTIVIEPAFKSAKFFTDGLACVRVGSKYGFIDKSGTFVINPNFLNAKSFSEGLAAVQINGRYGFIDKSGALVIKPKFLQVKSFSEGLAAVQIDRKYGYIDKSGKLVIEPDFRLAEPFSNGLARVSNPVTQRTGYINNSGKFVFHHPDNKASCLSNFTANLATVKLTNNKFIIIDTTGKRVGEFEADKAYEFTDGIN
jgi:hypothetical protein